MTDPIQILKDKFKDYLNIILQYIKETPVLHKALSSFLTSYGLIILSSVLFLSYMAHHHFYSYDFFDQGSLGVNQFSITFLGILLAATVLLFGWLWPFMYYFFEVTKEKNIRITALDESKSRFSNLLVSFKQLPKFINYTTTNGNWTFRFLILVLLCITIFIGTYLLLNIEIKHLGKVNYTKLILYIVSITFVIAFHIGIILFGKWRHSLISTIVMFTALIILSLVFRHEARLVISSPLKMYSVGGDVRATLCPDLNPSKACQEGVLVLLSPLHVYLLPDNLSGNKKNQVIIFKRTDFKRMTFR